MSTPDEAPLVAELRAAVKDEPCSEWATDAACLRFLRARKCNVAKATLMLRETLRWRKEFGVSSLSDRHEEVRKQSATGKLRVASCVDCDGRPVLVMSPRFENDKGNHEGNLLNLVYHLERVTGERRLGGGTGATASDGKVITVMDFRGYKLRNAPPMKTARATLSILQNHYPERLHKFVILHAPVLFYGLFRAISPFIDPVTKAKIDFVKGSADDQRAHLAKMFDLEQLDEPLGGNRSFEWDPDAYFADDLDLPSL